MEEGGDRVMSMNVHVWIKGESSGEIKGDSTVSSMGREGSIEAFELEFGVRTSQDPFRGSAGERIYSPITIKKRIDRASPDLHKMLCNNEPIEVTFRFYRPNPTGDGTTEQFYTIELKQARISSIKTISPNSIEDRTAALPAMEEVSFVFGEITWRYSSGDVNTEHQDQWRVP
jgi:type VI secretion system secreted protein Hcp